MSCHDLTWDIQKGKEVADYLKERTRENPWFAVASAVMHSCPCTYKKNQVYVERITKDNPELYLDPKYVRSRVKGSQHWTSRVALFPPATRCYLEHCSDDKACLTNEGRERLIDCLGEVKLRYETRNKGFKATGLGRKIQDLTREYLGDPNAVAVDRHVKNWACKRAKLVCPKNLKELDSDVVTPTTYVMVRDAIRTKARECGLKPAELQVAAWLSGACRATVVKRHGRPRAQTLYIGEGKTIHCIHRIMAPLHGER